LTTTNIVSHIEIQAILSLVSLHFLKPTVCEESHALVPLNPVFLDAEVFLLSFSYHGTDEFIDEEKVEYMFDTEGDLQTGVQTDNGIDSLSDTETDSQTETET
jgi:hypothetical protein